MSPAVTLIVWHATSPAVINPVHEMPIRWARIVGVGRRSVIPIRTTLAVFVFKKSAPHHSATFTSGSSLAPCFNMRLLIWASCSPLYGAAPPGPVAAMVLMANPAKSAKAEEGTIRTNDFMVVSLSEFASEVIRERLSLCCGMANTLLADSKMNLRPNHTGGISHLREMRGKKPVTSGNSLDFGCNEDSKFAAAGAVAPGQTPRFG